MKDDRHIEKMIRESLGMETAPDGFTEKIMSRILDEELEKEKALRSVFQKYAMYSPSAGFAEAVAEQMETAKNKLHYKSVIGKKTWIFIFVFVSSVLIYALLQQNGAEASSGIVGEMMDSALNKMAQTGSALNFELPAFLTNPLVGFSILAISSLLMIDKMVQDRKISLNI